MCYCTALHMRDTGQPCARRLLSYQKPRGLHRYLLMRMASLPSCERIFWEAQKKRRAQRMPSCEYCSIKEIERGALWGMTDASYYLPLLQECLPCMPRLCSCIAAPERGGPLP